LLAQLSPVRALRILLSGRSLNTPSTDIDIQEFVKRVEKEVERYFPSLGNCRVKIQTTQDHTGYHIKLDVPVIARIVSWIENLDYLLPIIANILALSFWIYSRAIAS
jgi:hypothetical protein